MKQKNLILECIEGAECKRYYIIRELPNIPNAPARTMAVCETADEVAEFLTSYQID